MTRHGRTVEALVRLLSVFPLEGTQRHQHLKLRSPIDEHSVDHDLVVPVASCLCGFAFGNQGQVVASLRVATLPRVLRTKGANDGHGLA